MPDKEIPVRFELSINGSHIATGGVRHSVTTMMLTRVARDPSRRPGWVGKGEEFDNEAWCKEQISVTLSGLDGNDHVRWVNERPINCGDEILIRVLGSGLVDEPGSRKTKEEMQAHLYRPRSSDGTRETELRELEEQFDLAKLDLLTSLNTPSGEFDESFERYEYILNRLLGALIGAADESDNNEAWAYRTQDKNVRTVHADFRRLIMAYRKNNASPESDPAKA